MERFDLSHDFEFKDISFLQKLAEKRYKTLSLILYKSLAYNTDIDDLFFLYTYISECFVKYEVVLENSGAFSEKKFIQEFTDEMTAIIAATSQVYKDLDLDSSIKFFIDHFLRFIFKDSIFNVMIMSLNSFPNYHVYKIVIEPITIHEEAVINDDENIGTRLGNFFTKLLSYYKDNHEYVSIATFNSNLWNDNYTNKAPEIIDDNIIPNFFNQFISLYKAVYKYRYVSLNMLGITDIDDNSQSIILEDYKENMYKYNIEVLLKKLDPTGCFKEFYKEIYIDPEEKESNAVAEENSRLFVELVDYSKFMETFSKTLGIFADTYNPSEDSEDLIKDDYTFNKTNSTPLYAIIKRLLKDKAFNDWSIEQNTMNIYYNMNYNSIYNDLNEKLKDISKESVYKQFLKSLTDNLLLNKNIETFSYKKNEDNQKKLDHNSEIEKNKESSDKKHKDIISLEIPDAEDPEYNIEYYPAEEDVKKNEELKKEFSKTISENIKNLLDYNDDNKNTTIEEDFIILDNKKYNIAKKDPNYITVFGFKKYIPDFYTLEEILFEMNFKDYLNNMIEMCVKLKKEINSVLIKKIIDGYKKDKIILEDIETMANKENFLIKVKTEYNDSIIFKFVYSLEAKKIFKTEIMDLNTKE